MEFKQLFEDDGAVSPVIGVILMVAITVILAAVIGTFVLGQADNLGESAPQVQFEYDGAPGSAYTVTHAGGQTFDAAQVNVSYTDDTDGPQNVLWSDGGSSGDVSAGGSFDTSALATPSGNVASGTEIRIVWNAPSGETSSTIGTYTVP